MTLFAFLAEATLISLSGVLAPGPITAVAVGKGSRSPHAGAWVAVGHGLVEFPVMVAVFFGVGYLMELSTVRAGIALAGGALLLAMGLGMLRGLKTVEVETSRDTRSPVLAGALLSLGNPYFLVWWATVGAALVIRSVGFGVVGFILFAVLHWLCDFIWSYFLSSLSFKGGAFFGKRFQQVVFAGCGAFLLFSGGKLLLDGVQVVFG